MKSLQLSTHKFYKNRMLNGVNKMTQGPLSSHFGRIPEQEGFYCHMLLEIAGFDSSFHVISVLDGLQYLGKRPVLSAPQKFLDGKWTKSESCRDFVRRHAGIRETKGFIETVEVVCEHI